MEIGTEISKKIRAAIKGKLQELGAYIDEELPDYIMVMVANKKTSQQMADDLSLFLGNNTINFTAWLHGVLEKLRTVAVEPASVRLEHPLSTATSKTEVLKTRSDKTESCSSAHENRRGSTEKASSRLTSAVKPLMELLPSDAVIDIKPELDDDFISEDAVVMAASARGRGARGVGSRPTAEIYRPNQSKLSSVLRSAEGSSHGRHQESRSSSKKEELSRKRKAPVASSVVRVNRDTDDDSDDFEEEEEEEEEDTSYGGRGMSSRVSLPSKPERKPSLPPAMQANRNLILKAISEAQDSITKTTTFPTLPQRQTVPVAPRARSARSSEMSAAIELVQQQPHRAASLGQSYKTDEQARRNRAPARSVGAHTQSDTSQLNEEAEKSDDSSGEPKQFDTRSFIVSRPQLDESRSQQDRKLREEIALPRTIQASKEKENSDSPKFIVTLEGIPSPLGNFPESDVDLEDVRPPLKLTNRESKVSIVDRLQGGPSMEDDLMDAEMFFDDSVPSKKQKVMERCRFWPVCKTGDECPYHHPTRICKTFPTCKFGDKCLFIHPNCKYDARCSKPDCPFTHVSRRSVFGPPSARPVASQKPTASMCRFFPQCKNMDCPFYHPQPCRFAAQCKRDGCTFFHPTASVPPRHALKWTKTQSS